MMVVDPPTRLITNGHSSSNMLTKSKSVRKGERFRSLVRCGYVLAVKDKPHRNVRVRNKTTCGRRVAAWVPYRGINLARGEMPCKTITGFSSGLAKVPNVATANETGNVDGCFNEAPASAKQAGVLHI
jgi:hypothetical protein